MSSIIIMIWISSDRKYKTFIQYFRIKNWVNIISQEVVVFPFFSKGNFGDMSGERGTWRSCKSLWPKGNYVKLWGWTLFLRPFCANIQHKYMFIGSCMSVVGNSILLITINAIICFIMYHSGNLHTAGTFTRSNSIK